MSTPAPPQLPSATGRESSIPAVAFARRHRHVTVPLAVPLLFLVAGALELAFRQYRGYVLTGGVLLCLFMFIHAPRRWDRAPEQWYARLSAAAAVGWLAAVSLTGFTMWTWIALGAGAIAWGVPWFAHKRPRRAAVARGIAAEWNTWWIHHAAYFGVPGSGLADVSTRAATDTLTVQLWAGKQTVRQLQDAMPLIESALRGYVRRGMVRVAPSPADPSQALVHLKRANPLAKPLTWDPAAQPATVTAPVPIGMTEEGEWLKAPLTVNWFIVGESRSGKSNQLSLKLAAITGCPDGRVWLIDMKGGRAARPWLPALDWLATTIEEARVMLGAALAEIQARAVHADDGSEQLTPTSEVPALFIVIDETHEVTSVSRGDGRCASLLEAIASMGMGLAVYVVVVTQYGALDESVRTEQTRGNLKYRLCFAVAEARHAQFALPDYSKLDASRLRDKGSFYARLGPDVTPVPARAPEMSHDLVRQIAARHGAMPRRPLVLYAGDQQEAYDQRWHRLPGHFRKLAPQCEGIEGPPVPLAAGGSAAASGTGTTPPADDMAEAAARAEAGAARVPDVSLAGMSLPSDAQLRREVDRRKARFARALMDAPETGISPDQLITATGLSNSWVHQQLGRLTGSGTVIKLGRGAYRAAPDTNVWDAMEALRTTDAALLGAA